MSYAKLTVAEIAVVTEWTRDHMITKHDGNMSIRVILRGDFMFNENAIMVICEHCDVHDASSLEGFVRIR